MNLIVKADVQGSVEAVKQSLTKLSNEEVVVKCIHGGVGAINESDVYAGVALPTRSSSASTCVRMRQQRRLRRREGVDIRLYKVIYQAIEDVEAAMKGMLDPVLRGEGHRPCRGTSDLQGIRNRKHRRFLCSGRRIYQRGCKVRITREGELIFEGALASLKRFKDDVKEVKAGFECGLVFEGFDKMKEFDIVEAYIMVEVPR